MTAATPKKPASKRTPEEQAAAGRTRADELGVPPPETVSPLRQEPPLDMGGITAVEAETEEQRAHEQEAADAAYVLDEARKIFADDLAEPGVRTTKDIDGRVVDADTGEVLTPKARVWRPGDKELIDVRGGGKYLPARRRLQWMRQEPPPHPDWGVRTEMVEHVLGTFKNKTGGGPRGSMAEIAGGFAIFKATILNEHGRVVAEAHATEWSDVFPDYIEKAETAAVARALAVAGYGTEAALDFDEGWEQGNIADAPVRANMNQIGPIANPGQGPITITASSVEGVRQGGRQSKATPAQLQAIRSFSRSLALTPTALQQVIKASLAPRAHPVFDNQLDDSPDSVNLLLGFLSDLPFEECGMIIQVLEAADTSSET